jgi:hypothetical protein
MAKVQGPLLSMGGGGQIGKSQVYSNWKGRPYVRRYVIPANPQSTEQTKTRKVFTLLNDMWRLAPGPMQTPWTAFASGKVLTNRNAFLSKNTSFLRPKGGAALDTLIGMTLSPGAKGGLVGAPVITAPAANIVFTAPQLDPLPSGWSIVGMTAVAMIDIDPQTDTPSLILIDQPDPPAGTDPWIATITAPGAGDYAAGAWFVFQRSASVTDLAYGPSVATAITVAP